MSEEVEYLEDDLDGRIANLAGALVNLDEIDPALLSEGRKKKLARMKRQLFDTLCIYCEAILPKEEEKNNEASS